jgi:4-hydroxybutyrate CoA-transferase
MKSFDEAFGAALRSDAQIYIHGGAATPTRLLFALTEYARHLTNVRTVSLHLEGPAPHVEPGMAGHIRHNTLFIGANVRNRVQEGRADFTPVFLADVPALFRSRQIPLDMALIQVSLPRSSWLLFPWSLCRRRSRRY